MNQLRSLLPKAIPALGAAALLTLEPCSAAPAQAADKLPLRILYAGKAGSDREADFVDFLKQQFRQVDTIGLPRLSTEEAARADVVLLDWDGDGFKAPAPKLPKTYARPTVTIGVAGGLWASRQRLKTGYM